MAVRDFLTEDERARLAALQRSTVAAATLDPMVQAQLAERLQRLPQRRDLSAAEALQQTARVRAHELVSKLSEMDLTKVQAWLDECNARPFDRISRTELRRRLAHQGDAVPLGDVSSYREWLERDQPDLARRVVVAEFLIDTAERSWAAPSAPVEALSERPLYEVREAVLSLPDGAEITVFYRLTFANDMVDLLGVMDA